MNFAAADVMSNLHQLLKAITERKDKLDRGPKRIATHQLRVDDASNKMELSRETLLASRMNVDGKQLQLKSSETKILDLQTKLNTCNNNREYQTLLEQIAADQMATSVLEDEILEGLEQVDAKAEEANVAAQLVENMKSQLKEEISRVETEANNLRTEITQLNTELHDAEKILPEDIRPDYDRIVKTRLDDSMASVSNGICEGCFQQITPNMIAQLALKLSVLCNSCGRLLYPAESD